MVTLYGTNPSVNAKRISHYGQQTRDGKRNMFKGMISTSPSRFFNNQSTIEQIVSAPRELSNESS